MSFEDWFAQILQKEGRPSTADIRTIHKSCKTAIKKGCSSESCTDFSTALLFASSEIRANRPEHLQVYLQRVAKTLNNSDDIQRCQRYLSCLACVYDSSDCLGVVMTGLDSVHLDVIVHTAVARRAFSCIEYLLVHAKVNPNSLARDIRDLRADQVLLQVISRSDPQRLHGPTWLDVAIALHNVEALVAILQSLKFDSETAFFQPLYTLLETDYCLARCLLAHMTSRALIDFMQKLISHARTDHSKHDLLQAFLSIETPDAYPTDVLAALFSDPQDVLEFLSDIQEDDVFHLWFAAFVYVLPIKDGEHLLSRIQSADDRSTHVIRSLLLFTKDAETDRYRSFCAHFITQISSHHLAHLANELCARDEDKALQLILSRIPIPQQLTLLDRSLAVESHKCIHLLINSAEQGRDHRIHGTIEDILIAKGMRHLIPL